MSLHMCVHKWGLELWKLKCHGELFCNSCVSMAKASIAHLIQLSLITAVISILAKVGIMLIIFDEDAIPLECSS